MGKLIPYVIVFVLGILAALYLVSKGILPADLFAGTGK